MIVSLAFVDLDHAVDELSQELPVCGVGLKITTWEESTEEVEEGSTVSNVLWNMIESAMTKQEPTIL